MIGSPEKPCRLQVGGHLCRNKLLLQHREKAKIEKTRTAKRNELGMRAYAALNPDILLFSSADCTPTVVLRCEAFFPWRWLILSEKQRAYYDFMKRKTSHSRIADNLTYNRQSMHYRYVHNDNCRLITNRSFRSRSITLIPGGDIG